MKIATTTRRLRNLMVGSISIASMLIAISSPASAAPGEESTPHLERAQGGIVQSIDRAAEAYNGGNHLTAWRGLDNNGIYMSINNGNIIRVSATDGTYAPPWVVAYRTGWLVFHTGTDGQIFAAGVLPDGSTNGWLAVPGIRTNPVQGVAATAINGNEIFLVHRGVSDGRIYGNFFINGAWSNPQIVGDAGTQTLDSPGITFNSANQRIYVTHRGLDGRVYLTWQEYGSGTWSGWRDLGGNIQGQPVIAALASGSMQLAVLGTDNRVWLAETDSRGEPVVSWVQESATQYSRSAPFLAYNAAHTLIFLLMTTLPYYQVTYKQSHN